MNPLITHHGKKRVSERLGVPKRAAKDFLKKVLKDGKIREEINGPLREYLDREYQKRKLIVMVYKEFVCILSLDYVLITTFKIPYKIRRLYVH